MKHSTKIKLTPNNTINEKVLDQDIKKTTSDVNQSFFQEMFSKMCPRCAVKEILFPFRNFSPNLMIIINFN